MEAEQVQQGKATLRQRFAAYRAALSPEEYRRRSTRIVTRLRALPEVQSAQVVHCYWPLPARGEVDTRPLIEALHASGCTVALPVVTSFEKKTPAMTARRYTGRGSLRENRWGLAEPAGTEAVPSQALGAVVVPAFGAGRNGHRIGHGRGFYDAFLAEVEASTVCPVYDACVIPHVPAEAHDVPMDVIVTETQGLRPSS